MTDIIKKVRDYAAQAHQGQERKYTPDPYIVHPERVMELCREHSQDHCLLCAALLHDVLEDTAVTAGELRDFLMSVMSDADARRTTELVIELTDVYVKKDYPRFNRRQRKEMERNRIAKTSVAAQTIKYADIIDNCREIVQHDPDFARVFLKECRSMLKVIPSGNRELYEEAKSLIEKKSGEISGRLSS